MEAEPEHIPKNPNVVLQPGVQIFAHCSVFLFLLLCGYARKLAPFAAKAVGFLDFIIMHSFIVTVIDSAIANGCYYE